MSFVQVKLIQFGNIGDNERRVDHLAAGFLLHPFLHLLHGNPIHLVPVLQFLVFLVLVPDECAPILESIGHHDPSLLTEVHIPGLNHAIECPIIEHMASHRFPNNGINFALYLEILPQDNLDNALVPIFPDNLLHHVLIPLLTVAMPIQDAVHHRGAHLCCEDTVQTIALRGQVDYFLAVEQARVVFYVVCVNGERGLVLEYRLQGR